MDNIWIESQDHSSQNSIAQSLVQLHPMHLLLTKSLQINKARNSDRLKNSLQKFFHMYFF